MFIESVAAGWSDPIKGWRKEYIGLYWTKSQWKRVDTLRVLPTSVKTNKG
jgi:hypothetical protein